LSELRSQIIELPDHLAVIEDYYRRGWTDGLPIVPPTPELVEERL